VSSETGDGGTLPDPRDRNLPARRRALAAGLVALLDRGDEVLADGLHRKRLAAISGQSRQTLYQHFRDHADYLSEMFRLVLDPMDDAWPTIDLVEYVREVIAHSPTDSLQIVHQLAATDFDNLSTDEHWQLVVTTWALARHRPDVAQGLAETWTHYNRRTAAVIQELMDQWDSALVPPFDTARAAHVFGALGEGLAMRAAVMDDVDRELFADTIAAIAHAIVVPVGEEHRFEPNLPSTTDLLDGPLDPLTVERIIGLALDHHTSVGRPPTFGQLARGSGVTEASVRAHFGDIDGVVIAAWDRLAVDLDRQAHDDGHADVLTRLRTHLSRLADVGATCPDLTAAFIAIVARPSRSEGAGSHRAIVVAAQPVEDLLREARQRDIVDFALPPDVVARHVAATTLAEAARFPRPYGYRKPDVDEIVDRVWHLVVDGLLAQAPIRSTAARD
jgi:AcrR family transcriptional regulator